MSFTPLQIKIGVGIVVGLILMSVLLLGIIGYAPAPQIIKKDITAEVFKSKIAER